MRRHVMAFVFGVAATSVACAAVLGIEDITNEPPGGSDTGVADGEAGNDGGTDSANNDSGDVGTTDGGPDVFVPPPPSCVGLPKNCGPQNNEDCCATILVTGTQGAQTFNRGNEAGAPATVPDFRLDKFEVTVGRFRKFVAAYQQNANTNDAGAHAGIAASGWQSPAFNNAMPANGAGFDTALVAPSCPVAGVAIPVWSAAPAANEQKPINCVNWFEAFAFCIYDGGYLPTELEWNYAAAGGADQRFYAWGNTPIPNNTTHSICGDIALANVGSKSPTGDAKFGHADILGNHAEWTLDFFAPYANPCNNCAQLTGAQRVRRGGDLTDACNDPDNVSTWGRRFEPPANRRADTGVRCARAK